jgi:hypothetical protein
MLKTITTLLAGVLILLGSGKFELVKAQAEDAVTVTFRVNTTTVPDTLRATDAVLMRGAYSIGNTGEWSEGEYLGQQISWETNTLSMNNVGGDYWELDVLINPGDAIHFKYFPIFADGSNTQAPDDGWEADPTRLVVISEDQTEDIVRDLDYWNRGMPFESMEGMRAVHFRVNVGSRVATGQFDPENEDHVVGVRGEVQENGSAFYKFVIDTPAGTQWEDGNDSFVPFAQSDTTLAWKFFNNERPPAGETVTAEVEFVANVGLLEELGYFNRAIGDAVAIPGGFNNWDSSTEMTYDEGFDVWRSTFELTREVGATVPFKIFIKWDESRFDSSSENYIPNLISGNGWEEPGATGGGDRLYTFTNETTQLATNDFGSGIGFFNSLPVQALITEDGVGASNMTVTFNVDMTDALSHETPFVPEEDDLYLVVETPIFGLTQGLSVGDGQPGLDDPEQRDRLRFTPTGEGNMYTLDLELDLPTENHFGFTLAYIKPDGERVLNGGGFDAGRRYYRYVTPELVLDDLTLWPATYELAHVDWKFDDLDFPAPPDYGLGDSFLADLAGTGDTLDWGSTLAATREAQPENRNHFYSATLYIPLDGTNIDDRFAETPREIKLSQNYPNPFNPTTNINFSLPEMADVRLDVFNVLGQRVATLANGTFTAGTHTVQFDASRLSSGMYLYRLQSGNFSTQRTMMLIK